jgi:hypothetical protein
MAERKLRLRRANEVVVRMYGQGFGDCFLLAFPRLKAGKPARANPVYVVIDSGVFFRTPGDRKRMQAVAKSINTATGGKIDLLVATHEHHDHLCGFEYAKAEWKKIKVGRIWLAWTEDEKHPATQKYDHEKAALQHQARLALNAVGDYLKQAPELAGELERVKALVEFAGEDDAGPLALNRPAKPGKIKGPKKLSQLPDAILDDLASNPGARFKRARAKTERDFCEPGQVLTVPETAVDAYVLGPPTDEARLAQDIDAGELYSHAPAGAETGCAVPAPALAEFAKRLELAAAADRAERESLGAALERRLAALAGDEAPADAGAPFPVRMGLPYPAASRHPFFDQAYFGGRPDRQIETDWLHGFGRLALQVDKVINNTSLVLAFRLLDERVLLFVGDAQVGNWLSWHEIEPKDWRRPDGGPLVYRPTAEQLLAQTVVYKVGHHGSHNATLQSRGLEMMQDGLTAFVPTSQVFPQENQKKKWVIPEPAVTDALWRKSGGRVVFPHESADYVYANTKFGDQVESADEMFEPMIQKGKIIEAAIPLWRQVRL